MSSQTETKSPMPKPFVVASALVLSLAIGASIWVYVAGTKSLRAQAKEQGIALYAEGAQSARSTTGASTNPPPLQIKSQAEQAIPRLLKQVDDWTLKVTVATAAGGAGLMLVMSLGMALWRQAWVSRIAMRGATLEQESQQYARQLQVAQSELDEAQIEARHQTALRAQVEGQLRTLQQDFDNMPFVQRGMKSRGFRGARPNPRQEVTVYNFHQTLAEYMGTGAPSLLSATSDKAP